MTAQPPGPIQAYFDATNAALPDAVGAAFIADGEVRDEGGVHRGRAAIADWARDTIGRYRMRADLRSVARDGDIHTAKARVTGDFPGSPLDFTYWFALADDGIRTLEITL